MDGPNKQEFHIRDLPTRSVTLFPTRAQVVRELKDVVLKPGANEIIVVGVTPTADEHSIKVEGTGSAIITDITVELLPNRDIFEEMYPDSDSESDQDPSDEDDDGQDKVNTALEQVRDRLVVLEDQQKVASETVASAQSRLRILDAFGNSLDRKRGVDIEASIETYRKEREKVFKDHLDGVARERELTKELVKLRREEARLVKIQVKEEEKTAREKAKVKRAKEKLKEKQRRREQERQKEKARIRKEREQFWPRSCYTVRISLDAALSFTPGSSRRSSIASATDVQLVSDKEPKTGEGAASLTCDLALSYLTSSAFWAPSYDLALSSTTNTATLCFDARLTNMTSETWTNSKVILSTSQANFSGLQDDTPTLVPWRLRIVGRGGHWDGLDIVHSREERAEKEIWRAAQNAADQQKSRANLFGISQGLEKSGHPAVLSASAPLLAPPPPPPPPLGLSMAPQAQAQAPAQVGGFGAGFGGAANNANVAPVTFGGVAYGNSNIAPRASALPAAAPQMLKSVKAKPSLTGFKKRAGAGSSLREADSYGGGGGGGDDSYGEEGEEEEDDEAADAQTILDPTPEVTFQDSSFEETGLTATYDLPHLKTLRPSTTASKQRVARLSFAHVAFSRTVVAKYKPAAYLRARLRNTSKLTLLRGPVGLTLDGTFLGRSTLPRCSAGDAFTVPLGVDPAIRVSYPKPEISRSTTGVFSKGENTVYTRSITLVNTRAGAGAGAGAAPPGAGGGGRAPPVSLTVLDQVPVSEDEKVRVDVLHPAGLAVGRAAVAAGAPGKEGKEEADWGRATAALKKGGEVAWDVLLNPGRSVKLVLRYEVAFPTGERVAQVY